MKYISETTDFQLNNSVVTLGKFDGLHIGHQLLVNHITRLKREGYQSVMFTFSLHPMNLFSEKELKLIYTSDEKCKRLEELGVDVLVVYPFSLQTASLEAKDFIQQVLVNQLDAKVIVVGSDYRFGHNRVGDVKMLQDYADEYGYEVVVYDKVLYDNEEVSSTRVRNEIANGNMELVANLLGKPYSILGTVEHGRKIGRTIGMPTANLIPSSSKLLPPNGVYASKTRILDQVYKGVTNVGYKPTVGGESILGVETYLFDYSGDIYGKEIEVELYHYQRAEQKFLSIDVLKEQMKKDIVNAREYFHLPIE